MFIFDNDSQPLILDSIYAPCVTDHFWVLDLIMRDYTLVPLQVLEEIVCPTVVARIQGFDFIAPANWNILVYDRDTTQLDTVTLAEAAGREFTALVYGPHCSAPQAGEITIVDYAPEYKNINPSMNKHQMLCHPISGSTWVSISPSDVYTKYLKNLSVGDLLY